MHTVCVATGTDNYSYTAYRAGPFLPRELVALFKFFQVQIHSVNYLEKIKVEREQLCPLVMILLVSTVQCGLQILADVYRALEALEP